MVESKHHVSRDQGGMQRNPSMEHVTRQLFITQLWCCQRTCRVLSRLNIMSHRSTTIYTSKVVLIYLRVYPDTLSLRTVPSKGQFRLPIVASVTIDGRSKVDCWRHESWAFVYRLGGIKQPFCINFSKQLSFYIYIACQFDIPLTFIF